MIPEVAPPTNNQTPSGVGVPIVKPIKSSTKENIYLVGIALFVVVAGILTGWVFTGKGRVGGTSLPTGVVGEDVKEAGSGDEKTFRDSAEGILKEGGISGEGTHHLERTGGPSQSVFLTSTVIDLDSFKDKKVKVWGETISAKKAGWLMDVGKIKVVD